MFQKIKRYLAEVWGEVKPNEGKVSWPTKDEVVDSTRVVVVTVLIFAVYLGVIDAAIGGFVRWALNIG